MDLRPASGGPASGLSDLDGIAVFQGIRPGWYLVRVFKEQYAPGSAEVRFLPAGPQQITVLLRIATAEVGGVVVGERAGPRADGGRRGRPLWNG